MANSPTCMYERAEPPAQAPSIATLAEYSEPVPASLPCEAVYERFSESPDLLALAVVEQGVPVGLVNRQTFLTKLADRYGRALFEAKPITRLMDPDPLIVELSLSLDELSFLIVQERPSALLDGFVVTDAGRFVGIGTALSLLTLTVEATRKRNRQLAQARARAEAANQTKTEFLANMSHELRTPLNAVIGFSHILANQAYGPLGERRYVEYAADIHKAGEHLLAIINDILDIAKIEAGKLQISDEIINIDSVFASATRMVQERALRDGISVTAEIDPAACCLKGDPRLVKQIVINLLSNAVKFSHSRGRVVLKAAKLVDGQLMISVRDFGIGMSEDEVAKALEPFGQVDSRLERKYEGVGLELPLVKRMTEAHGGKLSIDSAPGRGTCVSIVLPAERHLPAACAKSAGAASLRGRRRPSRA